MAYVYLSVAVLLEVVATASLPLSHNFTRLWPTVAVLAAYALSFYALTFAMRDLPVAVVYASWSGVGVFLIAVAGQVFYGQHLTWPVILGLVLIVAGVVLVNAG